jgi:hypothetical protein
MKAKINEEKKWSIGAIMERKKKITSIHVSCLSRTDKQKSEGKHPSRTHFLFFSQEERNNV